MATARTIITRMYRKLGLVDPGESIPADWAALALEELNAMLTTLGTAKLNIFTIDRTVFPLVIGQQAYTLGTPGADFTMPRPQRIDMLSVVPASDSTLEIPIEMDTVETWREIGIKSTTCSWPTECLVTNGFPKWTLEFWPIPSELSSVVVYSWGPLQQFADLDAALAMPEGYEDWAVYNLAVRMCPNFNMQPDPVVAGMAAETRQLIKTANFTPVITELDGMFDSGGVSSNAASTNGYLVD